MLLRDAVRLQRHPEGPAERSEERSVLSDHVLPTSLDERTLTTALFTSQSAGAIILNQATRCVFSVLEGLPPPVTISGVPEERQGKKLNGKYYPVPGETCGGKPVYKSVSTDMWIEFNSEVKKWHVKPVSGRGTTKCTMTSECGETSVANTVDAVSSGWKVYNQSSKKFEVQQSVEVQRGTGTSHMMIDSMAIPITAGERDLCMPGDAVVLSLVERIDVHMSVLVDMLEGQQEKADNPAEGIAQMLGLLRIMMMNLRSLSKDNISTVKAGSSQASRVACRADIEELRVSSGESSMYHLFDGNSGTQWQSNGHKPHWIEMKLTADLRIESVEVEFRIDDSYRPNAIKLEFYDGLAWRALEDTENICISAHGKHTLINGISQTFTGLKLYVLSNHDSGNDSRIMALNISVAQDGLHQHACADKVLDVSTRRRVFDSAKKLNVVLRKLREECLLPAPQAAVTAGLGTGGDRGAAVGHGPPWDFIRGAYAFDVFISHAWDDDDEGRDNHARAKRLNEGLQRLGVKTWFYDEQMQGNILQRMAEGIERSAVVLICVSRK